MAITQETVLVVLDDFQIEIDILDALILFSYLTQSEIENPLWRLHGEAQCLKIANGISYRRLKEATTIKLLDRTEQVLRPDTEIRLIARTTIVNKHIDK